MGFVTVWVANFCFILPLMHSEIIPNPPASHYCWIYYLCTDEPLVRDSLLEPRQRPPAQGNPERKRISEKTALPKGKPSRKENHLRNDCHPERKRIPGE